MKMNCRLITLGTTIIAAVQIAHSKAPDSHSTISPDGKYEVTARPKPGEEEFTSQVVILRRRPRKELYSEDIIPYAPNDPVFDADWNSSSSVVAVSTKQDKWGRNTFFCAVTSESAKAISGGLDIPDAESGEYEYRDNCSQQPVRWVGPADYLIWYKEVKRRKPDGDWQVKRGFSTLRFVAHSDGKIQCVELRSSDSPQDRFDDADNELNYYWADLQNADKISKDAKTALLKSQRAWINYRDAEAMARAVLDDSDRFRCMEALTRQRTLEIRGYLGDNDDE